MLREVELQLENATRLLASIELSCTEWNQMGFSMSLNGKKFNAGHILSRSDVPSGMECLRSLFPQLHEIPTSLDPCLQSEYKYAYYLEQQEKDIVSLRKDESLSLLDIDFNTIPQLSSEEYQKLSQYQPATIAAAARLPGIRSSTLVALLKYVKRKDRSPRPQSNQQSMRQTISRQLDQENL